LRVTQLNLGVADAEREAFEIGLLGETAESREQKDRLRLEVEKREQESKLKQAEERRLAAFREKNESEQKKQESQENGKARVQDLGNFTNTQRKKIFSDAVIVATRQRPVSPDELARLRGLQLELSLTDVERLNLEFGLLGDFTVTWGTHKAEREPEPIGKPFRYNPDNFTATELAKLKEEKILEGGRKYDSSNGVTVTPPASPRSIALSKRVSVKGFVYVMSNKTMPGLVKIGYSTKHPELRAKELDGSGLPYAYIVEYCAFLENPFDVEQATHRRLSDNNEAKEFFRVSIDDAIMCLLEAAKEIGVDLLYEEDAFGLRKQAEEEAARRAEDATRAERKKQFNVWLRAAVAKGHLVESDLSGLQELQLKLGITNRERERFEIEFLGKTSFGMVNDYIAWQKEQKEQKERQEKLLEAERNKDPKVKKESYLARREKALEADRNLKETLSRQIMESRERAERAAAERAEAISAYSALTGTSPQEVLEKLRTNQLELKSCGTGLRVGINLDI